MVVVGTYHLILETSHQMDLMETFYVPSISRNLISVSILDYAGYSVLFGYKKLSLISNSIIVGHAILCDGLYKLILNHEFAQSLVILHSNYWFKAWPD